MECISLTNEQISAIKSKDVMLFMYAEGGAMGDAGSILILTKEERTVKCYKGNYIYSNLNMKKVENLIPAYKSFLNSDELVGWEYVYLEAGNHLFIKDWIYELLQKHAKDAGKELCAISMQDVTEVLEDDSNNNYGKLYNLQWSRNELTSQKLGTFCEYYAKMVLASYGLDIYTSEVDDHGIDFVAEINGRFLKFQVKSVRLATTKYAFAHKDKFTITDNSLFMFLILLTDGEHPQSYIIPTSVWREDTGSKLFVDHDNYSPPEWGVNISKKNMPQLDKYSIDEMIVKLCK